jgi:hypothetical protein
MSFFNDFTKEVELSSAITRFALRIIIQAWSDDLQE